MTRSALYVRVSTLDQHPENQLNDLRQLAEQRGWQVVREYTDHGISGARARRPGLDQLLADARRGQFDLVAVWASDRLARSTRDFTAAALSHPPAVALQAACISSPPSVTCIVFFR